MTAITLKPSNYGTNSMHLRVNGKLIAISGRISEIKQVSGGRWEGMANGYPFTILGGRASGGASNEWYVCWEPISSENFIPVSSAVKAVSCIEFS